MSAFYLVGYSTTLWMTFWTAVGLQSMRMWTASLSEDVDPPVEPPHDRTPRIRAVEELLAEVFPEGVTI